MARALVKVLLIGLILLVTGCTSTSKGTPVAAPDVANVSATATAKTAGGAPSAPAPEGTGGSNGTGGDKAVGKAQTVKDGKDSAVITLKSMRTSSKGEDGI